MIGKKINQLATELAPVSTDLTIIGDPTTGVSKKITLAQLGAIFSGAVSFYTNLAGFPAVGDINVIYCAKDTQKLYLWSGSAYVEVFPSQALLDTYQLRSEKGNANGYASLDSQGKVPISQLPSSIMEYKGTWNASTNTPTLANGTGDTGDVYICNVAGTVNFGAGAITFAVGDYVIYSGTIWQRSSGAVGTVTSVAASITGNSVTISGSPVTTSGTLAFAFAGTGAQYIKGDGTLATFPNTIDQAKNLITEVYNSTGATLTKGTVVYINGGQGNLPTVTKALASGDSTSAQTYGIVQADITNMNNGFVVVAGRLTDIDTQAYANGTQLYLSSTTAGAYTSTKQYAPAHLVYIGIIVRSHPTQGVIEVKIQNGYELDELHNVAAQTPTNNDGLFWEASTSLWKNKSIATILGYTPQAQLNGTGFVKASGTTITYDNSTYLTTSAAATTYLPLVLSSTTNVVDINGQQFNIYGSGSGFTSGRIIIDPVFSAIGYQNAGVFDGLKILTNGNAEFSNSGVTRFFNQVRFDSTLTNGTYTYTLPGATGTIALTSDLTGGTVTSVGLSSATSGVTIGSTPITTSGTITLAIATASGSQQGLLSSTDWTTFNNKQNALTNPVTGTGTTNYLPKFTGTSTIGNSLLTDDGTTLSYGNNIVTIGASNTSEKYLQINSSTGILYLGGTSGEHYIYGAGNKPINFYTNGTSKMLLTASGNLGLGVTPSAWASGIKAIDVNAYASFFGDNDTTFISNNGFLNSSFSWIYKANNLATYYRQQSGQHIWYNAPSGTAGNAISFTQAMTLNASGSLGIGTTTMSSGIPLSISAGSGLNTNIAFQQNSVNKWFIRNLDTSDDFSFFYVPSSAERLRITSGGLLGIGTSNPTRSLQITRTSTAFINAEGSIVAFGSSDTELRLFGNNTETMTLKSGNVGIGTTSPDIFGRFYTQTLGISSSGSTVIQINGGSGSYGQIDFGAGGVRTAGISASANETQWGSVTAIPAIIYTNGSERMRITSGGAVGIKTTPSSGWGSSMAALQIGTGGVLSNWTGANNNFTIGVNAYDNGAGSQIRLYTGGVSNIGFNEDVITFSNAGSSSAGTTISYNERMRITSGGEVLINRTSSITSSFKLQVSGPNGGILANATGGGDANFYSSSTSIQYHFYADSGAAKFYVVNGGQIYSTSTSISAISDIRHKENIRTIETGLNEILALKPSRFDWKEGKGTGKKNVAGFIAQDIEAVLPDLVDEWKEHMHSNDSFKSIRMSDLIPTLVKAIQELKAELDTLKNK